MSCEMSHSRMLWLWAGIGYGPRYAYGPGPYAYDGGPRYYRHRGYRYY